MMNNDDTLYEGTSIVFRLCNCFADNSYDTTYIEKPVIKHKNVRALNQSQVNSKFSYKNNPVVHRKIIK